MSCALALPGSQPQPLHAISGLETTPPFYEAVNGLKLLRTYTPSTKYEPEHDHARHILCLPGCAWQRHPARERGGAAGVCSLHYYSLDRPLLYSLFQMLHAMGIKDAVDNLGGWNTRCLQERLGKKVDYRTASS